VNFDFSNEATSAIGRLDATPAGRVIKGIMGLPGKGDTKPLEGEHAGRLRLRVGDWRILYTVKDNTVMIDDILPRGDAYK
jgi:mRNA interferase RelE/StbE